MDPLFDSEWPDLQHKSWSRRNSAIKKISKLKNKNSVAALINIIQDRRPACWWRRFMGEHFYQVGFSRRNAWLGLAEQNIQLGQILPLFELGLADDYYEVRTATWNAIGKIAHRKEEEIPTAIKIQLKKLIFQENNFEIMMAALSAADKILNNEELLSLSHHIQNFKHWRVRAAYLDCLSRVVKNNQIEPDVIEKKLQEFNMRSEYFRPVFMLKEKGAQLEQLLK